MIEAPNQSPSNQPEIKKSYVFEIPGDEYHSFDIARFDANVGREKGKTPTPELQDKWSSAIDAARQFLSKWGLDQYLEFREIDDPYNEPFYGAAEKEGYKFKRERKLEWNPQGHIREIVEVTIEELSPTQ